MAATIEELRREIDRIDSLIVENLAKRRGIVLELAGIKKENGIKIFDPSREKELKERIRRKANDSGLDENFVLKLYDIILEKSKKEQENENLRQG
jgi:chorismate mutase